MSHKCIACVADTGAGLYHPSQLRSGFKRRVDNQEWWINHATQWAGMGNDVKNWLDIVRSLADHNAPVRVSLSSKPVDEGGAWARVRVLTLGADGITVIEEPSVRDLGTRLRPGKDVDILAIHQQTRLVGCCRVNGYTKHMLNETVRVDAVQVSPPVRVFSGQLRDFFRVQIGAGVGVAPVLLKIDPQDEPTLERARIASLDTEKNHKVRLVNLSGGGMGLAMVLEKSQYRVFGLGTVCNLQAQLPTLEKPLDLKARVVHTETLDNGDLYLGVEFFFDDPAQQHHVQDQLQRLSVWLQRQILKKERQD